MTTITGIPPLPDLPLPPPAARRPYVAINMVTSADGKTTWGPENIPPPGAGPTIGSAVDRAWMKTLRSGFDAIARGAGTVRRHPYYPGLPSTPSPAGTLATPPQFVVFTRTGELPLDSRAFRESPRPVLVVAGSLPYQQRQRLEKAGAIVWEFGQGADDDRLLAALSRLYQEAGVRRLLLEGGPHLNHQFLRLGAVDELFFTVAARLIGRSGSLSLVEGPDWLAHLRLELVSVYQHQSELFLRYKIHG
ncbi:MAG: RibD family protein [Limnochordaceae bacterium]|nr:RibD family protein [Limnochordaceae bacterium]